MSSPIEGEDFLLTEQKGKVMENKCDYFETGCRWLNVFGKKIKISRGLK